jgi:hypothetical protein
MKARQIQFIKIVYAASIGDINELKRLVAHNHDLNKADYDGAHPLMMRKGINTVSVR